MSGLYPGIARFAHEAMTTFFEIFVSDPDTEYARQAAQAAFREIDRLEGLFNRFDPGSELSRINRLAAGAEIPVGIETFECLALAEAVRQETGGAFDANARAASTGGAKSGESTDFMLVSESGVFFVRKEPVPGRKEIRLDLDLGGVGKGYAVDRAAAVLLEWGISAALIHGGTSSVRAFGSPAPDSSTGWPVGVGGGWTGVPPRVKLSGRSLSGSGTEIKGGHILDPRTGLPARGNLAAWASTPSAALSDALSTAFFVMDPGSVEAYAAGRPDLWACLVVTSNDVRIFNTSLLPWIQDDDK